MECLHLFLQGCQIRQSENACALQVWENIIFQNKTFLVMFYRQNKTFWYQFCNFKHFLKAENNEDSLASLWHSKPMVSSVTLLELSDCWHYVWSHTHKYRMYMYVWKSKDRGRLRKWFDFRKHTASIIGQLYAILRCFCFKRLYWSLVDMYVKLKNSDCWFILPFSDVCAQVQLDFTPCWQFRSMATTHLPIIKHWR